MEMQVFDAGSDALLADRVRRADRFWLRLVGLLFRSALAEGEGLLLKPCGSIHTLGMRFPIDVVFLDADGIVLRLLPDLPPWRIPPPVRGASQVLELAAGTIARSKLSVGARLRFSDVPRLDRRAALG